MGTGLKSARKLGLTRTRGKVAKESKLACYLFMRSQMTTLSPSRLGPSHLLIETLGDISVGVYGGRVIAAVPVEVHGGLPL